MLLHLVYQLSPRSHAPAWECIPSIGLNTSSHAMQIEKNGSHARAWEPFRELQV